MILFHIVSLQQFESSLIGSGMNNRIIENYILQQKVGSGQYGNVYRAQHKIEKGFFAVKVMNIQKFKETPKLSEFTNNEMAVLTKINHPNIIKFKEMLKTNNNFYLVYQYCNGGTLSQYIQKKGRLTEEQALVILEQLVSAYATLNQYHILHRDLKPTNIIFHQNVVKLADFGFCKQLLRQNDMTQTMVGSPIYMAPQVLKGLMYDARADVWSLGVILYEMLYGKCPYEQSSIPKLISSIDNTYIQFPNEPAVSVQTKQLIMKMLMIKYRDRITPTELRQYQVGKKKNRNKIEVNYKYVGKFMRRALIYLTQSLEILTQNIDDITCLRLAYLIFKIIDCIQKDTLKDGIFWQNLNIDIRNQYWEDVILQQAKILEPYGQITKKSLQKQDNSLKTKVQLETKYIDSKFFLDSMRKVTDGQTNMRLYNCMLYNRLFCMVNEKRTPDWIDPTEDGLTLKQKQEICLKYARYY